MAGRKARSVTFRLPFAVSPLELKESIDKEIESKIVVCQELGSGDFLIELEGQQDAERLVEEGFDIGHTHVGCNPPQGQFTNVSILNLRSYISDDEVIEVLGQYGQVKSDVIRLKYKATHAFAGLENGNRLVKMVLEKKSIPYSLRIGGEWCRIIHNNQEPVCTECNELGHTRKRCPKIVCRICKEHGHMSYVCEKKNVPVREEQGEDQAPVTVEEIAPVLNPEMVEEGKSSTPIDVKTPANVSGTEASNVCNETITSNEAVNVVENETITSNEAVNVVDNETIISNEADDLGNDEVADMETENMVQGCKRQLSMDSDSDFIKVVRRTKIRPVPNLKAARPRDKSASKGSK